jgi:hypothetical protein
MVLDEQRGRSRVVAALAGTLDLGVELGAQVSGL